MRKLKLLILSIVSFVIMPMFAFASGGISPSTNAINLTEGGSTTFTVKATNAVGRIDISTSNSSVASINVTSKWLENNSVTITVTSGSAGSANIVVKLTDAATFDEEELTGSYTIKVNVTAKQTETKPNKPTKPTQDTRSQNNELDTISVDGYELTKIENEKTYILNVSNGVDKIVINATAKDEKATVTGAGEKNLEIGENSFEIVITSESGKKNIIIVKVTRKDVYYIEDLKDALNSSDSQIDIILNANKITKDIIDSIKNSNKIISFDKYDENKLLLYSWLINSKKIKNSNEFNTNVNITENSDKLDKLTNYANGLYISFEHKGDLPEGTKVKLFVGNKYKNGDLLNFYYYNEKDNKLELIKKDITVKDGYVEIDMNHCSNYYLTKADFNKKNSNPFIAISIVELGLIISMTVFYIIKNKKDNRTS